MDETFQLRIGCLSYLPYLVESQLAGEHDLSESAILQKAHFPRCAVVTLGAGMKGNGGKIHPQKTHVLHYQRIDTGMIKLPDKAFHGIELAVVDDGVDRDVDLDTASAPWRMASRAMSAFAAGASSSSILIS